MSNWKHAYGWSGHILVSADDYKSNLIDNVIAIPADKHGQLFEDMNNLRLDSRIQCEQLGITSSDCIFLAAGSCFSAGFKFYGTIFQEAELRKEPGPPLIDHDAEYLIAMREVYGLELPPCQLMIGCSSEH